MADTSDTANRSFPLPHVLQPGEIVEGHAEANGAVIAVTKQRLVVAEGG
jgi:hypothetical protein